MAVSAVAYG